MNGNDQLSSILTTIILSISIIALIANTAEVIFLLKRGKTLHIYLLLSLCITDFLFSLSYSVFIVLLIMKFHPFVIYFLWIIIVMILSSYVHLAAIAIDRFLSVFYPIYHRIMADRRRVKTMVFVPIWSILALGLVAFIFGSLMTGFMTDKHKNEGRALLQISCCV